LTKDLTTSIHPRFHALVVINGQQKTQNPIGKKGVKMNPKVAFKNSYTFKSP
jgi:hypothetical protein